MTTNNEYITINEAIKATGKSKSTIRRFVAVFKENENIINISSNSKNRPLYKINKKFILTYFNPSSEYNKKNEKNSSQPPECNKCYDIKQRIDIDSRKDIRQSRVILKKSSIKILITSIIIVILIMLIMIFYSVNNHKLSKNKVKILEDEILSLKTRNQENIQLYKLEIKRLEEIHHNLENSQQKRIEYLKSKLIKNEQESAK